MDMQRCCTFSAKALAAAALLVWREVSCGKMAGNRNEDMIKAAFSGGKAVRVRGDSAVYGAEHGCGVHGYRKCNVYV